MTKYTVDSAVRDYLISKGHNSLQEYPRALLAATKALKDLHYDVAAVPQVEVLDVENGAKATLPQDFIRLVRVGYIGEDGRIIDIYTDNQLAVNAQGSYNSTTGTNQVQATASGGLNWSISDISSMFRNGQMIGRQYGNVGGGAYTFRIDWDRGLLEFSSNVSGQIVIEYLGDPNKVDGQYTYHPFLNDALQDGIHYYMMKFKRSYAPAEKAEAHRVYLNSKHHANVRLKSTSVREMFNISRRTLNQSAKF